ncbi:DUF4260 family protein [Hymenobacter negativus]|uniref:DUF4260 family protein n=1 Tax=Hymenobacter negativus TaxID=2795026 RepID=A0ABS3QKW3_9BACT|nr:DUF4260 family protein [Hymenobacter negativus]
MQRVSGNATGLPWFTDLTCGRQLFTAIFLFSDLSMLSYVAGPHIRGASCNLMHQKKLALAAGLGGWFLGRHSHCWRAHANIANPG